MHDCENVAAGARDDWRADQRQNVAMMRRARCANDLKRPNVVHGGHGIAKARANRRAQAQPALSAPARAASRDARRASIRP